MYLTGQLKKEKKERQIDGTGGASPFPYEVSSSSGAATKRNQAQQYSIIIPRGSAVETHELQSSSTLVKRAKKKKFTCSVCSREIYSAWNGTNRVSLTWRDVNSWGHAAHFQRWIDVCACFLALEQTNPRLKRWGGKKEEREREDEQHRWMQKRYQRGRK